MTFKAGQSGNPNGRPKGSRNKQTLAVIDRLEALAATPSRAWPGLPWMRARTQAVAHRCTRNWLSMSRLKTP
ncbi:MAG: DUF5681 domain-containing protein [Pseudomonadota bacterium]|nr:DUF5681 domain-containing protein [Pseudomonadota bacterium]